MPVDLYCDGELGLWALDNVCVEQVAQVITTDAVVYKFARDRGFTTTSDPPGACAPSTAVTALSLHYHRLLPVRVLSRYKRAYNIHPGLLPWGRGYYPAFWALWEGTPAGATLHEISSALDRGPLVEQRQVLYHDSDTGMTLHHRVHAEEQGLFITHWARLVSGEALPTYIRSEEGSYHSRQEFYDLKSRICTEELSATTLIRLVRALTYPGYPALELTLGGKHFELQLSERQ